MTLPYCQTDSHIRLLSAVGRDCRVTLPYRQTERTVRLSHIRLLSVVGNPHTVRLTRTVRLTVISDCCLLSGGTAVAASSPRNCVRLLSPLLLRVQLSQFIWAVGVVYRLLSRLTSPAGAASGQHEDTSVEMFEYMVKVNDLMPRFAAAGLTEMDITFIKEQIAGPCPDTGKYIGRTGKKAFLYEVRGVLDDGKGTEVFRETTEPRHGGSCGGRTVPEPYQGKCAVKVWLFGLLVRLTAGVGSCYHNAQVYVIETGSHDHCSPAPLKPQVTIICNRR